MKPMDALGPKEIRSAPQWTRMYLSGVAAVHAAATGGASPSQPAAELPMKDAARAAGLAFFSVEPMQELAQELAAPLSEESYSAYLQRVRVYVHMQSLIKFPLNLRLFFILSHLLLRTARSRHVRRSWRSSSQPSTRGCPFKPIFTPFSEVRQAITIQVIVEGGRHRRQFISHQHRVAMRKHVCQLSRKEA